jgi:CHRD domain
MRQLGFLALCVLAVACESSTDVVGTDIFAATLDGAKVKPTAVTTSGSGTLTITLKSNTSLLAYDLSFAGLSSAATAIEIHGPAVDTAVAGLLVDFAALPQGGQGTIQLGTAGSAKGTIDLHKPVATGVSGDSLFILLHAGKLYIDVRTSGNSGGEIRGQIAKK